MKRGPAWGVVACYVETQCQNLNWVSVQTIGVVLLAPDFMNHLVISFKHDLHQKVTFQDICSVDPSGKILEGESRTTRTPPSDWTHTYFNQKLSTWGFRLYSFNRDSLVTSKSYAFCSFLSTVYFLKSRRARTYIHTFDTEQRKSYTWNHSLWLFGPGR